MIDFLNNSFDLPVFTGLTIIFFGGISWLTGQSQARGWKPYIFIVLFSIMLSLANQFLTFALFDKELFSLPLFIMSFVYILMATSVSYRYHKIQKYVHQYPWLYKKTGLFWYKEL